MAILETMGGFPNPCAFHFPWLLSKAMREEKTKGDMKMSEKLYLQEVEVFRMTSIPVKSLRADRYLRRGIPFIKKGRSVLYSLKDVVDFLEHNKVQTSN